MLRELDYLTDVNHPIEGQVIATRPKALLIEFLTSSHLYPWKQFWMPRSVISIVEIHDDQTEGRRVDVSMPFWIIREKGLHRL